MEFSREIGIFMEEHRQEAFDLLLELAQIPAPSNHEEKRAAFCKNWFESIGAKGVFIDEALNVVCPYCVTEDGPVMVFMAHTDTVFPDMEPMPFYEDETTFRCPGVCDDTTNLAVLMLCLMYKVVKGPRFTDRILAVNAINTMLTASICLLSRYLGVAYLLDVALIYALLGFTGSTLLMRMLAVDKEEKEEEA